MKSTRPFRLATSLALAAASLASQAHAAEGWAATRTYAHDTSDALPGLAMAPGESVRVALPLRLRDQAGLDALTASLMAGHSSRHIAPAEFLDRFAPTAAQVDAVVAHLRQSGFTGIEVAPNRMLVTASGTAASVRTAFNAQLRHFSIDGRDAYANVTDAQVPAHLAATVNAVLGLQTVHLAHTFHRVATEATEATGTSTGQAVAHEPTEFPAIYDASSLPIATTATIGIVASGDITQTLADIQTFASMNGLPAPTVTEVLTGPAGVPNTKGTEEFNMDSQSSLSAAGGHIKEMRFYVGTTLSDADLTSAYNQAVADDKAQVINVSIGGCEDEYVASGAEAAGDAIFEIAVAQGQVFSVATGDSGSFQCNSARGGESFPAVSPYVIAVGGTLLKTTNQTTWAGESAWACTSSLSCNLFGGTGGGVSDSEAAPAWQVKAGVLGTSTQRGIPDVAFDGNPSSGAKVLIGTATKTIGGTSLAAPLFAGFWARIQAAHGNALVFPATAIYKFGPTKSKLMFHDVTSGSNGGYQAATGWDYTSGFGSLDVAKFSSFVDAHPGF